MKIDWKPFRDAVIKFLKGESIKLAFKLLFKSAAFGSIRLWLIKLAVNEFYNEIGEPIIKAVFVEGGYIYHKAEGKIIVKRIKEAKDANDQTKYDAAMDDIFK
jgi:hypothetical protein